jgi:hypothetical protein
VLIMSIAQVIQMMLPCDKWWMDAVMLLLYYTILMYICLPTVRFECVTFAEECQWTTNHGKIKGITPSLVLLSSQRQHKYFCDNMDDITKSCILFINTSCFTVYILQGNINSTFYLNITIYIFCHPFSVAPRMSSAWKFHNMYRCPSKV